MERDDGSALYYFHEGTASEAYRFFGAHREETTSGYRYRFRTYAPHAEGVWLVSDVTGWQEGREMTRITEGGVFETRLDSPSDLSLMPYKFRVVSRGGARLKGDPYAFASRGGSDGASLLCGIPCHDWQDGDYLAARRVAYADRELSLPINVYEVHLASFLRREDGGYLSYSELAEQLLAYAKYMGYTHIELLPVAEYPYDASWGYQVCGYFAPTARFGTPEEFCAFVDRLHAGGVGVILDWVPAHFPKDEWGLYEFDGEPLYEYAVPWRREARSWGTRYFDLGRREVRSFLISSAIFWLREYHIDGLRVDAVASMLYLDYDRADGEWESAPDGSNRSPEAEGFFRALSTAVSAAVPDALLIAEESTDYPGVTSPPEEGGLGFHLKWNMGFANDLYEYLSLSPSDRPSHHTALNFPITYAFRERYILPISHDEVVHGKRAFLDKMFGGYPEKLMAFRAALLFLMTFPGKKLLFMGTEYGQLREWNYDAALDWSLLGNESHDALREYVAALNAFYLSSPPLYELDFSEEGFSWLLADEAERALVAYLRHSRAKETLVVLVSFSDKENRGVRLSLPQGGRYRTVFSTGACGGEYETEGADNRLTLTLPPYCGLVLRRCEDHLTL